MPENVFLLISFRLFKGKVRDIDNKFNHMEYKSQQVFLLLRIMSIIVLC